MSRLASRSRVVLVIAAIAAIAIVSPALGGPSVRSLVRKEVSKQISKATGPAGPPGSPGTARAYAYVNPGSNPSFDSSRTKGFTAVSSGATGFYCLTPASGIDPSATAPAVTPVWNSGVLSPSFAQLVSPSDMPAPARCSASQVPVYTYTSSGTSFPATTGAVAFTVVLP